MERQQLVFQGPPPALPDPIEAIRSATESERDSTRRLASSLSVVLAPLALVLAFLWARRDGSLRWVRERRVWIFGITFGIFVVLTLLPGVSSTGKVGVVRRDPMAMIAFVGYNMGDYFAHWLKMGGAVKQPPKIFRVNWFRRDANGKFMWPGFAENMRVLQWIVERCNGRAQGSETPLGTMPRFEDLTWTGLEKVSAAQFAELERVDHDAWKAELSSHDELFGKLGSHLPRDLEARRGRMHERLD